MKIHKIITPNFYKKFKCAGSDCLNDCCHGWSIYIDKKTHDKYINSPHQEIKNTAKESLRLTRKGKNKYSVIRFNENGKCPFFTADKLCKIHQKMGGEALSKTCAGYPRTESTWGDQLRRNMSMSCSEVARLVLFEQESMLQHEEINLIASSAKKNLSHNHRLGQKNQLIHLFAWNLVSAQSNGIEANLLALAQFIIYLQRINFDLSNRLPEAEAFCNELILALNSSQLTEHSVASEQAALLKLRAIMAIFKDDINATVRNLSLRDNYILIAEYLDKTDSSDIAAIQTKFARVNQQWQQLCTTSCLKEPWVMRNYFRYQIYTSYFPGNDLSLIMRQFYRMVMDYFFLKFSLSVKSLHQEINQQDVVELFADYYQYAITP
ncbi:flagellin lysine-N-methylase [Pantoea alhagi]|uniref:flagellin lysine-N-methylase n=1 Tax=Pantoea alhagi TaxID=1891675 RepID=UPI001ABF8AFE|nr:flagellin lysine-N-methylase [Pantoea alhagi]